VPFCEKQGHNAQVLVEKQETFRDIVSFGMRLREERKRRKLSQEAFGTLGGVHYNSQSSYEKGASEPSATYFAGLAAAGVDVHWLLTGQRSTGTLDEDLSVVVDAFTPLSHEQRDAILRIIRAFSN
jgi:transcriptional regulator with XRE-family HTH domain